MQLAEKPQFPGSSTLNIREPAPQDPLATKRTNLKANIMASSLFSATTNYSIYALPIYYALAMLPHGVAIKIAIEGKPSKWDNRNPRAAGLKTDVQKRLGPARFQKYERAESAHYNTLESFPLFAVAVILANLAKLPTQELNQFVYGIFALRIAYIIVYISTSSQLPTYLRTSIWYVQVAWKFKIMWLAAAHFA